jgi:hypothetical protein
MKTMKVHIASRGLLVASLGAASALLAANDAVLASQKPESKSPAGQTDPSRGRIAAPPGSETLTADVADNTIELFESHNFDGTTATLNASEAAPQSGGLSELPRGLNDSLTSLRWNLRPGIIVVFYEDGAGKGEQLVIWGKGQSADISRWDFNDKASRWAWYNVGAAGPGASAGGARLPHGAHALSESVPDNTLQLFVDKKFENDMKQVSPVTGQAAGQLHTVPAAEADSLTSLRWNLPDGVIVLLHQDADGRKQQAAIWGEGQIEDLDVWDFNDKASRWSWAYVGAAPGS